MRADDHVGTYGRWIVYALSLLVSVLIGGALGGCGDGDSEQPEPDGPSAESLEAMSDDGGPGPSVKVVKFKNMSGKRVGMGLTNHQGKKPDGTDADHRYFPHHSHEIPDGNQPGQFKKKPSTHPEQTPGYQEARFEANTKDKRYQTWVLWWQFKGEQKCFKVVCPIPNATAKHDLNEVYGEFAPDEKNAGKYKFTYRIAYYTWNGSEYPEPPSETSAVTIRGLEPIHAHPDPD